MKPTISQARPRTILIAMPYFYPAIGGIEKHIFELSKRMKAAADLNIVVVASHHDATGAKSIDYIEGLKIIRLPMWVKVANTPVNPMWYFDLKQIIKAERPDVIMAHAPVPFMADLAALAAGKIPFILGYHFPSMHKGVLIPDLIIGAYERFILPLTCRRADAILPSSQFVSDGFLKAYSAKITTIAQGVDTTLFKPGRSKPIKGRVLFVGNLASDVKGLTTLIESIAKARTDGAPLSLRVVGNGDLPKYEALATRLDIAEQVSFAGPKGGAELAQEYRDAEIFALPSYIDNFPSVLLEAGATARPVVASRVGGVPGLIDGTTTGLLVPARDSAALSTALARLHQDPKLAQKLASNLQARVLGNFEWDQKASETITAVERVITRTSVNVIQIAPQYPPSLGGVQNCVREFAERLDASGYNVSVYSSSGHAKAPAAAKTGPQVHYLRHITLANTPILFTLLPRLLWAARRPRTIMHVHVAQAFAPEIVWLVAKLTRTPYIAHFHADIDASGPLGFLLNFYKKHLVSRVLSQADHVIAFTQEFKDRIIQKYGAHIRVAIIPNGVSENLMELTLVRQDIPHILYVGRLGVEKNINVLIDAMSRLKTPAILDIVGSGPEDGALKQQAKALGLTNVIFHGAKTGNDLIARHQHATIFALASSGEGMPLTLLDAMAAGLPIVASDVRGIHELVGSDGLLVPEIDGAQFAEAITKLLSDPKLYASLQAAGKQKAQHYGWDTIVGDVANLYQTTLEARETSQK